MRVAQTQNKDVRDSLLHFIYGVTSLRKLCYALQQTAAKENEVVQKLQGALLHAEPVMVGVCVSWLVS